MNLVAVNSLKRFVDSIFGNNSTIYGLIVLLVIMLVAFVLSRYIAKIIVKLTTLVGSQSDATSDEPRSIRLRQLETYLNISTATIRIIIAIVAVYVFLALVFPNHGLLISTVGAGTLFFVVGGATIAPLLRDITSGLIMIIEGWYKVGDYISIAPFASMDGVVEKVSLRSTKLRQLSGEIVWIHNQFIQSIRTTPRGLRTINIDIFVNNLEAGKKLVENVSQILPNQPTMMASPLSIIEREELANGMWRITSAAQTAPGREWLVDDFLCAALKDADQYNSTKQKTIIYGPLVRYIDETAEKRFRRAIRTKNR
ncbi:MAG: mechanosensitive ion channel domain-containing protein [Candidatus Saccharimonadales bacterium]